MSRLIDADELLKKAVPTEPTAQFHCVDVNDIVNAPTVEERKKGHWHFEEYPDGYHHSECSVCEHWFIEDAFLKPYNYCPNCGADMRGGNL